MSVSSREGTPKPVLSYSGSIGGKLSSSLSPVGSNSITQTSPSKKIVFPWGDNTLLHSSVKKPGFWSKLGNGEFQTAFFYAKLWFFGCIGNHNSYARALILHYIKAKSPAQTAELLQHLKSRFLESPSWFERFFGGNSTESQLKLLKAVFSAKTPSDEEKNDNLGFTFPLAKQRLISSIFADLPASNCIELFDELIQNSGEDDSQREVKNTIYNIFSNLGKEALKESSNTDEVARINEAMKRAVTLLAEGCKQEKTELIQLFKEALEDKKKKIESTEGIWKFFERVLEKTDAPRDDLQYIFPELSTAHQIRALRFLLQKGEKDNEQDLIRKQNLAKTFLDKLKEMAHGQAQILALFANAKEGWVSDRVEKKQPDVAVSAFLFAAMSLKEQKKTLLEKCVPKEEKDSEFIKALFASSRIEQTVLKKLFDDFITGTIDAIRDRQEGVRKQFLAHLGLLFEALDKDNQLQIIREQFKNVSIERKDSFEIIKKCLEEISNERAQELYKSDPWMEFILCLDIVKQKAVLFEASEQSEQKQKENLLPLAQNLKESLRQKDLNGKTLLSRDGSAFLNEILRTYGKQNLKLEAVKEEIVGKLAPELLAELAFLIVREVKEKEKFEDLSGFKQNLLQAVFENQLSKEGIVEVLKIRFLREAVFEGKLKLNLGLAESQYIHVSLDAFLKEVKVPRKNKNGEVCFDALFKKDKERKLYLDALFKKLLKGNKKLQEEYLSYISTSSSKSTSSKLKEMKDKLSRKGTELKNKLERKTDSFRSKRSDLTRKLKRKLSRSSGTNTTPTKGTLELPQTESQSKEGSKSKKGGIFSFFKKKSSVSKSSKSPTVLSKLPQKN